MTVGDLILERLASAWGVRRIYGFPGDGIEGIVGAFDHEGPRPEFVQVSRERSAAFMACAHAKFTGEVGVCLATGGPGAIHLLNGLYDAKLDHAPVVAIVGQHPRHGLGGERQQELDLRALLGDLVRDRVHTATEPAQIPDLIDGAVRIALAESTVTCVIVPNDVQMQEAIDIPNEHASAASWEPPATGERPLLLDALADPEASLRPASVLQA